MITESRGFPFSHTFDIIYKVLGLCPRDGVSGWSAASHPSLHAWISLNRWVTMLLKLLADFVVLVHFLWVVFLFLGGIWGVRNKLIKIAHLSGLLFAILIQVFGWYCPLTHLEVWLRSKHDPALAYVGSFIIHYLEKLVYLDISPSMILIFTILLCAFNGCLYFRKTTRL